MKPKLILTLLILIPFLGGTAEPGKSREKKDKTNQMDNKIIKSDEEWKKILNEEAFKILRKKGTERAFTGKYHDFKEKGIYICAACGHELFSSETKYDSGTGWPSFFKPIKNENVGEEIDKGFFMTRTEVHCARCGGHLGHVFPDGPQPTGLRYCINSASLDFKKKDSE